MSKHVPRCPDEVKAPSPSKKKIKYIDRMWDDWGHQMRRHYKGWPSENHIWRIYLEQAISSDDFGPRCPNVPMGLELHVEEIHKVFHTMPDDKQLFAWIFYVKRWGKNRKAKELDLSVTKMYEARNSLHAYTEGRLYKIEYVPNDPPVKSVLV